MPFKYLLVIALALIGSLLPGSTGIPVSSTDQGNSTAMKPCTPPTVAIMISGQLQRFIYRDQSGPLLEGQDVLKAYKMLTIDWGKKSEEDCHWQCICTKTETGCHNEGKCHRYVWTESTKNCMLYETAALNSACAPVADVYIALSNATLTKPWSGVVTSVPYLNVSNVDEITKWYKNRGARHVEIKIVSEAELLHVEKVARKFVRSAQPQKLAMRFDKMIEKGHGGKGHWFANFRQYYMRHTVYALTLKRSYTAHTVWRDDNFFLKPLDLTLMLPILREQPNAVFVNKYCGWGAFSDKIYVLNRASAGRFLSSTFPAFLAKILAWVRSAYEKGSKDCPVHYVKCGLQYLQSETWLKTSLEQDKAQIHKWDFHRTEKRYMNDLLCVSWEYYHCTPELRTLVLEGSTKVCNEGFGKRSSAHWPWGSPNKLSAKSG